MPIPFGDGFQLVTAKELLDAPREHGSWGPWRLDPAVLVLYPVEPYRYYEVDLERCRTSAQVLDRLLQVAGKTWADDACLAGLVRALGDVLHPQAHLCSSGRDQQLRGDKLTELVRQAAAIEARRRA